MKSSVSPPVPSRLPSANAVAACLALAAAGGLAGCANVPLGGPAAAATAASAAPSGAPAAGVGAAASPHGAAKPGAATPASAGASAPAAAPSPSGPGQPPAFATVIKDARQLDGSFTLWQKDERLWIELGEKDFDTPLFLSPKLARGIGEAAVFGGLMGGRFGAAGGPQLVQFRRIYNQVQLIAVNTDFVAGGSAAAARAVAQGFSPSLVGSAAVASQPHPQRKSVLVEIGPMFLGDQMGIGAYLQRQFRQGYSLDSRNTAITRVRNNEREAVIEVQSHFATANLATPQGASPGAPAPSVPETLPDPRSLFVTTLYSLSRLPETPMAPRRGDARVGLFQTMVLDFGDDLDRSPKRRMVNRWRLERKDAGEAPSEPVKPITFWLDRTIPDKYRAVVRDGVLEWNKAFERIGFRNAIVVKDQPADADFDTLDLSYASIRWMTNVAPAFGAIGPSHVDPRSGEILDADIAIESLSARAVRAARSQVLASSRPLLDWARRLQARDALAQLADEAPPVDASAWRPTLAHEHDAHCAHADLAAEQLSYAFDVLAARGELDPASPEAEQWVLDYLKDTTMHEVGHVLGLRHNFRSSRIYSQQQLADVEFTRTNGLAGSVMEYAPINLAAPGERRGQPFQLTLGPYDYWAIEYAYKPLAPADEAAELNRIAARSGEAPLAYGTDEDNYLGLDPESLQMDLGDDPMAYARKRLAIARDLLQRQEARELDPTRDYAVLRRSINYALRDVGTAMGIVARQIGGLRTLRDFPNTGRDPLQPVPAAQQREAMEVLMQGVFGADGLAVSPALQRRLAPDYQERGEALGGGAIATDFSPPRVLGDLQRTLLTQLLSDGLAARLLDNEDKLDRSAERFRVGELYERLTREIWAGLGGAEPSAARRDLQRDHANRLAALVLRPASAGRAEARSLVRQQAQALLERLDAALKRPGLGVDARRHLADSAEVLREALAARLVRTAS